MGGCRIFGGSGAARLLGLDGCWGRALWIAADDTRRWMEEIRKKSVIDFSIFFFKTKDISCNFVLTFFDDVMNKRPKNKKMRTGIRSLHIWKKHLC